jgi:hypothetical protein
VGSKLSSVKFLKFSFLGFLEVGFAEFPPSVQDARVGYLRPWAHNVIVGEVTGVKQAGEAKTGESFFVSVKDEFAAGPGFLGYRSLLNFQVDLDGTGPIATETNALGVVAEGFDVSASAAFWTVDFS